MGKILGKLNGLNKEPEAAKAYFKSEYSGKLGNRSGDTEEGFLWCKFSDLKPRVVREQY